MIGIAILLLPHIIGARRIRTTQAAAFRQTSSRNSPWRRSRPLLCLHKWIRNGAQRMRITSLGLTVERQGTRVDAAGAAT